VSFELPTAVDAVVAAVAEGGLIGAVVGKEVDVWAGKDPLNNRIRARMDAQVWSILDCLFMVLLFRVLLIQQGHTFAKSQRREPGFLRALRDPIETNHVLCSAPGFHRSGAFTRDAP
jgi:hypothetical protein